MPFVVSDGGDRLDSRFVSLAARISVIMKLGRAFRRMAVWFWVKTVIADDVRSDCSNVRVLKCMGDDRFGVHFV